MKIITRDDPFIIKHYSDIIGLFGYIDFEIIKDDLGTYRFKKDPLITYLRNAYKFSLNGICEDYQNAVITRDDFARFNISIGYSLSGFGEIFAEDLDNYVKNERRKERDAKKKEKLDA